MKREGYANGESLESLVERLSPSVVSIEMHQRVTQSIDPRNPEQLQTPHWRGIAGGSGFFVSEDGIVATNRHVVEGDGNGEMAVVTRTESGKAFETGVIYVDPVRDLALLEVPGGNHTPVQLGDSDTIKKGMDIFVMGSPLGVEGAISAGVITATPGKPSVGDSRRKENQKQYIKTDADIRPGSSGGAMFNTQGEVIGLNSVAFIDGEGSGSIGGSIAINEVKVVLENPRIFQAIQDLFTDIQLMRAAEEPLTLREAFDGVLMAFELIFGGELGQVSEEVQKKIMKDVAVQYYFQQLLQPARSPYYQEKFEEVFGVSLGKEKIKGGEGAPSDK